MKFGQVFCQIPYAIVLNHAFGNRLFFFKGQDKSRLVNYTVIMYSLFGFDF